VPVAYRGKNPTVAGWQTYTHERVTAELASSVKRYRKGGFQQQIERAPILRGDTVNNCRLDVRESQFAATILK
jgi:hypothetical protein